MNWDDLFPQLGDLGFLGGQRTLPLLALALFGSMVSSLVISFLYSRFFASRATGSRIHRAFPLIAISCTSIFIAIQFSLPLSLGLLGALSIVRFRTPIKEPEEIGFIMLVVASSLAWATLQVQLLGLILLAALVALLVTARWRLFRGRLNDGMLIVTVPTAEYREKSSELLQALQRSLPKGRIDSVSENRDESVLSYSFLRLDQETLLDLQKEVREVCREATSNVFFNRSGEV